MKIGICGGTFDPFHRGHLEPLLAVRDVMQWTRIIFVPARRQPFKSDRTAVSPYHRFAMAALATDPFDFIWVSPWELERDAVSYTVDTLEAFRAKDLDATFDWVIGDDNLAKLGEWKSLPRILELANFVVLSRAGEAVAPAIEAVAERAGRAIEIIDEPSRRPAHGAVVIAGNAMLPISSTDIRNRARAGEAIDSFVDPRVAHYIDHYGLYRAS